MQTRLSVALLISLATLTSGAVAQDGAALAPTGITQGDIVGPLPPLLGLLACYELVDEPNFCVLPDSPRIVNHTMPLNVIDLNGAWTDQNGVRPYIYVYNQPSAAAGYTIAVDLSLVNRPDGFGYFVSGSTIAIVFPDDRDYTGTIEADGRTIRWSNNTVWTKL
jgi:hypothetical protein